jgi:hypothetical protein
MRQPRSGSFLVSPAPGYVVYVDPWPAWWSDAPLLPAYYGVDAAEFFAMLEGRTSEGAEPMSKPLLTSEEFDKVNEALAILTTAINNMELQHAPEDEIEALKDFLLKLGQGMVLCADPHELGETSKAVAESMRERVEMVLTSPMAQEVRAARPHE